MHMSVWVHEPMSACSFLGTISDTLHCITLMDK